MFFETSAKIHNNIVEVFKNSIQFILNNITEISNVKLKYENENDFEIKLTDYGLAKSYQNNNMIIIIFIPFINKVILKIKIY